VFQSNKQLVKAHNAAGRSFSLALNRFADWTQVCLARRAAHSTYYFQRTAINCVHSLGCHCNGIIICNLVKRQHNTAT
jgi:hypothetical protein